MNTIKAQGFNLQTFKVGDIVKLKGIRSNIDGRRAQTAKITGIIGGISDTESRQAGDRFILSDGKNQYYGIGRSQFTRL